MNLLTAALHTEPARKPLQAAIKQQVSAVSKKASAKKTASETKAKTVGADSDMENAEDIKPEPTATVEEKSKPDDGAKAESGEGDAKGHPEYGAPPHPDAEITMIGSKAVWQYINDKGEEITVVSSWPACDLQYCCCTQQLLPLFLRRVWQSLNE